MRYLIYKMFDYLSKTHNEFDYRLKTEYARGYNEGYRNGREAEKQKRRALKEVILSQLTPGIDPLTKTISKQYIDNLDWPAE